jgi:hypothetical protein
LTDKLNDVLRKLDDLVEGNKQLNKLNREQMNESLEDALKTKKGGDSEMLKQAVAAVVKFTNEKSELEKKSK